LENLSKIIEKTVIKVHMELVKIGAKKISIDVVQKNMDELTLTLETEIKDWLQKAALEHEKIKDDMAKEHKAAMDKIEAEALDLKNRLVVSGLEETTREFKLMLLK